MKKRMRKILDSIQFVLYIVSFFVRDILLVFLLWRGIYYTYSGILLRLDIPVTGRVLAGIAVAATITEFAYLNWIARY